MAVSPSPSAGFGIEDYFRLQRIPELALSSDGVWLAYVTESADNGRTVHLRTTVSGAPDKVVRELADAHGLAWVPKTHELAYISAADAHLIFAYDALTGARRELLRARDPVVSFRYSPDAGSIAYLTQAEAPAAASLYRQFQDGHKPILVDSDTTSSHDFLNPDWNSLVRPARRVLWVKTGHSAAIRILLPGSPEGREWGFWSGDSRRLSVTYVASNATADQLAGDHSSVGIFDLAAGRFHPLANGNAPAAGHPGVSYLGGEWVPGTTSILLRRVIERDPWLSDSFPDWTIIDITRGRLGSVQWRPMEAYPVELHFTPVSTTTLLVENTVASVHSLFLITPQGVVRSPIVGRLDGSSSNFQFSADRSVVAFINQSLVRPPEIYLRIGTSPPRCVTQLNNSIRRQVGFGRKQLVWNSVDGTSIQGWLLTPPRSAGQRPWPVIAFVHGGPSFPFPDEFEPYFDYWPHPLGVLAQRGIAVFIPNYRGTQSFGLKVASDRDYAAIGDIVTGVKSLIARGIADRARLGIAGHSHGAWLGPLVMARSKLFNAASFAEGVANSVVMYELMSGEANRDIHDKIVGASLYAAPQRYLDESPDLEFRGVHTAALFESGARAAAIFMLGFPKAAKRAGMPTEFFVYPQTGHNISDPSLQRQAAYQNLAWFRFWLQGYEEPGPDKRERYARWESLCDQQIRRNPGLPTFCVPSKASRRSGAAQAP